ncbi:MAG: CoA-acylating methylmalonate-semialdehyde dehydrogenase [Acidobacteria bacterium]|nr:MAG: CoA-acylating methylmalonate-semialdehyde dehydrogenase [Acidobacteriota bacterium]
MSTSGVTDSKAPRDLQLYINGQWQRPRTGQFQEVRNPATGDVLGQVPLVTGDDVGRAVRAASRAFPDWRRTPPQDRIQYLFKLKQILEDHFEEIARTITTENGKTVAESRGELRRAVENVEVACGIPSLMQGYNLEDVAQGIDETMVRQPLGVVAAITPFNFPAMIPFWFLPYALACGNTFILKPSERVPFSSAFLFELMEQLRLPPGVLTLVHGSKAAVDALLEHPDVRAISFVGSTPVAKHVYAHAAAHGKRVQCQGGAKNPVLVLPDADMDAATRITCDSAFGCAGQRCLAVSVAVTVGDAREKFTQSIAEAASSIRVGNGLLEDVQMGPVISQESKARIESFIARGMDDGAKVLLDGRDDAIARGKGNFLRPTLLENVPPDSVVAQNEIFGPVLSLSHVKTLDEGLEFLARNPYGNQASIFTTSGAAARRFRYEAPVGNVGINIGVAAPMAYFPFSGWKDSFFGALHAQGRDAVQFYTQEKVVIERWPKEWSRKF